MFERFTPRARHAIVLAQEEARGLQHNYIGTEHVLLGLLGEPESIGARALAGFGLTLTNAREEVLASVGPGPGAKDGHIPFTPRAKKVLELALREALALQHNYIGTEHLLLGLVRENEGVGAQIITAHAPEPAPVRVRMAVLDLLPAAAAPTRQGRFRRPQLSEFDPASEADATPATERTLDEAARLAGSNPVGSQHLLIAALADPESAAARALAGLGIDLEQAKSALAAVDVTGTTDELPEDAGRRQMRLRVTDEMVTIEATDPTLLELGRLALDAVADDLTDDGAISGELPAAASLSAVWRALHDALGDVRRRGSGAVSESEPEPEAPPDE
jgi:ATP-dependent Clp protease ATP-binding subunit ClpC